MRQLLRQCTRPVALSFERAEALARSSTGTPQPAYTDVHVTLYEGPLGAKLETVVKCGGLQQAIGVKLITPKHSLPRGEPGAAELAGVRAGDLLSSVGGDSVEGLAFAEVLALLQAAPRPAELLFRGRRERAAGETGVAGAGAGAEPTAKTELATSVRADEAEDDDSAAML